MDYQTEDGRILARRTRHHSYRVIVDNITIGEIYDDRETYLLLDLGDGRFEHLSSKKYYDVQDIVDDMLKVIKH